MKETWFPVYPIGQSMTEPSPDLIPPSPDAPDSELLKPFAAADEFYEPLTITRTWVPAGPQPQPTSWSEDSASEDPDLADPDPRDPDPGVSDPEDLGRIPEPVRNQLRHWAQSPPEMVRADLMTVYESPSRGSLNTYSACAESMGLDDLSRLIDQVLNQ